MKHEIETQTKTQIKSDFLEELLVGKSPLVEFTSVEEAMESFEDLIRYELEDVCRELRVQADRSFTIDDEAFLVEVTCNGKRFVVVVGLRIVGEIIDVREVV
jgi:hypothetical protein